MSIEDAIDLVGYPQTFGGRARVVWHDRGVRLAGRKGRNAYLYLGATECIDRNEAVKLVEATTGRKPGGRGRKPRERSYAQMIASARGDFPDSGAKINSYMRRPALVHPMQARIMETLNIIREKGEVKHGRAGLAECAAAAWIVLESHRLGIPCDKEPIILVGRKAWHDGFAEALEAHGIEYERVYA